jgi:putative membrane protein insertion efficiency factor
MSPLAFALKSLILAYRWGISLLLPASCRFRPTCSEYALDAIASHGALRGTVLTVRRLLRCHPWGESGFDPVPEPRKVRKQGMAGGAR